jgi:hypothetical protein
MSLDVVYQGLPIAKAARVRFEEGALFIETDGPMPVATELALLHGEQSLSGRVKRVREGAGAGMFVTAAGGAKLPRWLMALHPESTHAAEFEPEPPPSVAAEPVVSSPATVDSTTADSQPSTRTPDSEGDSTSASSDEDDDSKSAKPGDKKAAASKAKKKPRRR